MTADAMVWVQRTLGAVFVLGVVALVGAIVSQVGQAEGIPPLPVFLGVLGIVVLVLVSGACLALISLAISARRGLAMLQALSARPVAGAGAARIVPARPMHEPSQKDNAPAERPLRPAGRTLVAER